MTTINAPPVVARSSHAAAILSAPGERVLLPGISWRTYESLRDELDAAHSRLRLTYDAGDLEIEMPTELHEILAAITTQLLQQYLLHADTAFSSLGNTTWKRQAAAKGLESDGCFYIQNVDRIAGLIEIDLDHLPPPDLAIESEISRPLLPKLPVYAAMQIPEVWHLRQDLSVQFLKLSGRAYSAIDRSVAAPLFTPELLASYLTFRITAIDSVTIKKFKAEVLDKIGSK